MLLRPRCLSSALASIAAASLRPPPLAWSAPAAAWSTSLTSVRFSSQCIATPARANHTFSVVRLRPLTRAASTHAASTAASTAAANAAAAVELATADHLHCWRCGKTLPAAPPPSAAATAAPATAASSSSAPAASAQPTASSALASAAATLAAHPSLFCPHCRTLQASAAHHPATSFFHFFNIPLAFNVSLPALEAAYKSLQKSLHPDRFAGAQQADRHAVASHLSSLVNSAYVTLKSPYERALYLLSLHGMPLGEGSGSITDPALLMEVMEAREELEEMTSVEQLMAAARTNRAAVRTVLEQLDAAYEQRDLATMRQHTIRLSFLHNIQDEIHKRMPVT